MTLTPAKLFGLVVSNGNACIRQEVLPGVESGQVNQVRLNAGEVLITIPVVPFPSSQAYYNYIQSAIISVMGRSPGSNICAVVDNTNTVVQMIMADATIDMAPPGQMLVNNVTAFVGCTYNPSTGFTAPPFVSPKAGTAV